MIKCNLLGRDDKSFWECWFRIRNIWDCEYWLIEPFLIVSKQTLNLNTLPYRHIQMILCQCIQIFISLLILSICKHHLHIYSILRQFPFSLSIVNELLLAFVVSNLLDLIMFSRGEWFLHRLDFAFNESRLAVFCHTSIVGSTLLSYSTNTYSSLWPFGWFPSIYGLLLDVRLQSRVMNLHRWFWDKNIYSFETSILLIMRYL